MEVPAAYVPDKLLRRELAAEGPAWRWLKTAAASLAAREAARRRCSPVRAAVGEAGLWGSSGVLAAGSFVAMAGSATPMGGSAGGLNAGRAAWCAAAVCRSGGNVARRGGARGVGLGTGLRVVSALAWGEPARRPRAAAASA